MRKLLALALALVPASPALAGTGAAELALDRGSVLALMAAHTPEPRTLVLPGVGNVTFAVKPPKTVRFVDGGVEAVIGLELQELGYAEPVDVRLEPRVRREDGVVELVATRVLAEGVLAMVPDLEALVRPVALPRTFHSLLEPDGAPTTEVIVSIQRVRVDDERLVMELGLVTKPAPADVPLSKK